MTSNRNVYVIVLISAISLILFGALWFDVDMIRHVMQQDDRVVTASLRQQQPVEEEQADKVVVEEVTHTRHEHVRHSRRKLLVRSEGKEEPNGELAGLAKLSGMDGGNICDKDPLNEACELVSFPDKPLTVEQIKLCDPKMHAQLNHGKAEYTCEEDGTCRKCRRHSSKMKKMVDSFRNKTLAERRGREFDKRFGEMVNGTVVKRRPVVVIAVNYGQVYLLLNWVCSCERLGLEPRNFTYIVTTDQKAYDELTRFGFLVEPLDWLTNIDMYVDERYSGLANVGPHAYINTMCTAGAEALLLYDYPVFLSDADVVWLRNVWDYLDKVAIYGRDIIGSYSPRDDAYGYINGGAVYFAPTKKSKVFLSSLLNVNVIKEASDQVLLNAMIRYYRFRELSVRIIPHAILNTHWSSGPLKHLRKDELPYFAHTVGLYKAPRFQKLGMWFFDPTCKSFDQDLLDHTNANNLINMTLYEQRLKLLNISGKTLPT